MAEFGFDILPELSWENITDAEVKRIDRQMMLEDLEKKYRYMKKRIRFWKAINFRKEEDQRNRLGLTRAEYERSFGGLRPELRWCESRRQWHR